MKFQSEIAAFLDTHLLFACDAGTKQLIGCKWVMGILDYYYHSRISATATTNLGIFNFINSDLKLKQQHQGYQLCHS